MIWNALDRHRDLGLLIARLGFGIGFLWFHGLPKLLGGPERWAGTGDAMASLGIGFGHTGWGLAAGVAEAVGGLLIAAGLFFRPTTVVLAGVMIVAATNHFVTGQGSPAHAFKNIWFFAGLFLIGPGRYSLDHLIARRTAGHRGGHAPEPAPAGRGVAPPNG